jgi:threonine dehydrogenase-like Zn-dependent dehydrogenase
MISTAPRRMRTAVISGPLHMDLCEAPRPTPKPDEVLIRLQGCGVCGSNIPPWEGRPWFRYPLEAGAPGHEGWGVIEETGSEVTKCSPGDRVAFLSSHAFAEFDIARADQVLRLPRELEAMPFPAEPLACAMNVLRRSRVQAGDRVAIVGVGFLGALVTRLATNASARVTAISRRPTALRIAAEFGAMQVVQWNGSGGVEELGSSEAKDFDCVIEAVGRQESLDLATQLTRERGTLVIAGYHQDGMRQVNMQLWNWRGLDVINAHERDWRVYVSGMEAAAAAVVAGDLDPRPLFTHDYPLDNLSDALEMARMRHDGFIKALVHA